MTGRNVGGRPQVETWLAATATALATTLWIVWALSRRLEPGLWGPVFLTIIAVVLDVRILRRRRRRNQ